VSVVVVDAAVCVCVCVCAGECSDGFIRVNNYTPCGNYSALTHYLSLAYFIHNPPSGVNSLQFHQDVCIKKTEFLAASLAYARFIRFSRTLTCNRRTDRHMTIA